jgi:branched-chain amino acid transport system substrate-binding protein
MGKLRGMRIAVALAAAMASTIAIAQATDISVGIILPQTGSAASFGVPMTNSASLMPTTIAGRKVNYTLLDSRSDITQTVANARKLISEYNVDVLIGEAMSPISLSLVPEAAEAKVPLLATAAIKDLAYPIDAKRRWVYQIVPTDDRTAPLVVKLLVGRGAKSLGIIGFNDAYLKTWRDLFDQLLPPTGIKVVAVESFERAATSTTPQALKLIAAKPDAIFLAAGGTAAVIPVRDLRQRGYKGLIVGGHGIGFAEFIDRGGGDVEGVMIAGEPFVVHKELAPDSPYRTISDKFVAAYKAKFGAEPPMMAAHIADCTTLLENATPEALKRGEPGTQAFRDGLRDALEEVKGLYLNVGHLTYSPTEHAGYDPAEMVLIVIKDGAFRIAK